MRQHKLSEERRAVTATGGALLSPSGAFSSEADLRFVFNVLLKQWSFFGEADDARPLLGFCWRGVTPGGTLAVPVVVVGTGVSPARGASGAGEGSGV